MSSTLSRVRRQQLILELVRSQPVANQEALRAALDEHGHSVTQSTLSRDLKDLKVVRVPQPGGYRYMPAGEETTLRSPSLSLGRIAAAEVLSVAANEVAAVLKTQNGRAQGVAAYLDSLELDDVLATVAGDDTILVSPQSIKRITTLERRLAELFELAPPVGS